MCNCDYWRKRVELEVLVGKTISRLTGLGKHSAEVIIETTDWDIYKLVYIRNSCKSVSLYDYESNTDDYSGALILSAEVVRKCIDSFTWNFYKLETSKGVIWMRWLGSNLFYSESIDLVWVNKPDWVWPADRTYLHTNK